MIIQILPGAITPGNFSDGNNIRRNLIETVHINDVAILSIIIEKSKAIQFISFIYLYTEANTHLKSA